MDFEREPTIALGNMFVQYNRDEIKVGLVQSCPKRRDTFYMGLACFSEILREIELDNGILPEITVGITGLKMAEFAKNRFNMNVKLVPREGAEGFHFKVWGNTDELRDKIEEIVSDPKRTDVLDKVLSQYKINKL